MPRATEYEPRAEANGVWWPSAAFKAVVGRRKMSLAGFDSQALPPFQCTPGLVSFGWSRLGRKPGHAG